METALSKVTPLREGDAAYRTPPANIEAEQALLGAILVNNAAFERVSGFLLKDHFAEPVHGRIFAAIGKLIERGQTANPVTLKNLFDQDGALQEIGGAAYLARLAASVVTIINAVDYGHTIHELHLRRQLITIGEDLVNDAYTHDLERDAPQQIETAEQRLFELATVGEFEGGFRAFKDSLKEAIQMAERAYQRSGRTTGISTGYVDLDKLLGGLHPADLVVIAGRPSMGKTALATNIGFNAARNFRPEPRPDGSIGAGDGARVGFFSLEMSSEQLATPHPRRTKRASPRTRSARARFRARTSIASSRRATRSPASRSISTTRRRSASPGSGPARGASNAPAASISWSSITCNCLRQRRRAAGQPGRRDFRDHPWPQDARQGTERAGDRLEPAIARGREARGQASNAVRLARNQARSSRTPPS